MIINLKLIFCIGISLILSLLTSTGIASNSDQIRVVPIQFQIVTDLDMNKKDQRLYSWITKEKIESKIMPELNRIWQQAHIQFKLIQVTNKKSLEHHKKNKYLKFIENAKRDSRGKANPKRIKKLNKLIDTSLESSDIITIYLVPYLGERSQGNAQRKKKRIFITQWTDKPSKAQQPPQRFQLIEARPFKKGSMSRTIAHEIGHILGLKHPDKLTQKEFNLLMGGKRAGYRLTLQDIKIARHNSLSFKIK